MAQTIVLNGQSYTIPDVSEDDWGLNLSNYFIAIPQAVLQKSGGAFALTADVNFGASFGLVGIYYKSRTANVSTSGVIRLAVTDALGWRNNANGGNLLLSVDASDRLVFNGTSIISNAITGLTGDVTATGPGSVAATIAANAVTNAKMATMITATAKANISGSTATPSDVSLVSAATASTIMLRDSNANVRVNSHIDNYTTTVTAAGTTVLTVASSRTQFFTGSTTQAVTLPDATTLVLGQQFFVVNRSSGVVTVSGNTGTVVKGMVANSFMTTTVTDISTAAGTWTIQYTANGASVSSVDMTVPTFLSVSGNPITGGGTLAVTLSGTALPLANGGTGQTTKASAFDSLSPMTSAGDLIYGGSAGTGTRLTAGTTSQYLKGGTTPAWQSFPTPTVQKFLSAPTGTTNYAFTITAGNTASVGAIYTNNGQTFTLIAALLVGDTVLYCSGNGTPAASGTLTYSSGTHTGGNITFSAFSGCYVLPAGALYIEVKMVGGGGGGGGSGTGSIGNGGTGGNTTFGTTLLVANGGTGAAANAVIGGTGGSASLGSGPIGTSLSGANGGSGCAGGLTTAAGGGMGGVSPFGGAGTGNYAGAGVAAISNTGSGGGGSGPTANTASAFAGAGGGSGGFVDAIITSPLAIYSYAVGTAGTAGTAGTSGSAGGAGGSGYIIVKEYFV